MTRPISDLDVPLPVLRQQITDLVARQREQRAEQSAERLRNLLAPTTNPIAEEAS
ncbi:hypothetical protein [Streptomyces sp. NPDC057115]|uniref:hypothetical protein n=1 Tax=Streptomyces sp. NPDC057115 TaxID=3346022 RepID=UPI003643B6C9